ncbi:MAG: ferredoxin [Selenomonas sp.]|nr:ferredoxin [Selenomonas sp.]
MFVDNVRVIIANGPFSAEDAQYYINRIRKSSKFTLKKIIFTRSDTYLDIRYSFDSIPFDRIRRIPLTDSHEDRAVNN